MAHKMTLEDVKKISPFLAENEGWQVYCEYMWKHKDRYGLDDEGFSNLALGFQAGFARNWES